MRYLTTMVWAVIFTEIIGFIGGALTQMDFNPMQSLIVGAIFGLVFNVLPLIMDKTERQSN